MDCLSYTPLFWNDNEEECKQKFANEKVWDSIPLLNINALHNLKDESLVRFRGMIQDMNFSEMYLKEYKVENTITKETFVKCGKYRDTADLAENEILHLNSPENAHGQRHKLIVITFPALNDWVHNFEEHEQKNNPDTSKPQIQKKRPLEENEPMEISTNITDKRICVENKPSSSIAVSVDHILNFPIPNKNAKSCIVKVYDTVINTFKLNEMVEILGFLSLDPILEKANYDDILDNEMEIQTHNPPPSLVPRLHCVLYKKLRYYNPLLKTIPIQNAEIFNLYTELHTVLSQLLFGDTLAADYLICHLISRVYLRTELTTLGKFTLNLSHIPSQTIPDFGEKLYEFLELFVTKSYYLPLALENLNELTYTPKKDYDCNRLTSGILQLSDNTHLILDETKMQPGQLGNAGYQAVSAIAYMITNQKVKYDFQYFPMEFDSDISTLILSEGTSMLPSDIQVPLKLINNSVNHFEDVIKAAKYFLKPDLLNNLRVYLTKVKHAEYNISDDISQMVQDKFVQLRKNDSKISSEHLHQLLVLARLVCLSRGKQTLDEECWKLACSMEQERRIRIEQIPRKC